MKTLNLYTLNELKKQSGKVCIYRAILENNEVYEWLSEMQDNDNKDELYCYTNENGVSHDLSKKYCLDDTDILYNELPRTDNYIYIDCSGDIIIEHVDINNDALYEYLKEYGKNHGWTIFQLSLVKWACKKNLIFLFFYTNLGDIEWGEEVSYVGRDSFYNLISPALDELAKALQQYLENIVSHTIAENDYTDIFATSYTIPGDDGRRRYEYIYKDEISKNLRDNILDALSENGLLFTNKGDFICYEWQLKNNKIED